MTSSGRRFKGQTAQERVHDRRQRLLGAALDLVGDRGVAGLTAESVCERAGLTKRYFYESFSDREAVLVALFSEFFDSLALRIVEAIKASADTHDGRLRATAETLVETLVSDPRLARLYVEAPAVPALLTRRSAAINEYASLVIEQVVRNDGDDPRARFVAVVAAAGVTEALTRWLDNREISQSEVIELIVDIGRALARAPGALSSPQPGDNFA